MKKNKLRKRVKKYMGADWKDLSKTQRLMLLAKGAYQLWKDEQNKRKLAIKRV